MSHQSPTLSYKYVEKHIYFLFDYVFYMVNGAIKNLETNALSIIIAQTKMFRLNYSLLFFPNLFQNSLVNHQL